MSIKLAVHEKFQCVVANVDVQMIIQTGLILPKMTSFSTLLFFCIIPHNASKPGCQSVVFIPDFFSFVSSIHALQSH